MKKSIVLALMLVMCIAVFGQDGISFTNSNWEEILAKAKAEDKIVFVDAYTTWCGPCKWMAANAFPDKSVGEFYNSTFVNAKIDMEKGEGIEIAQKYEVRAYPTLLFVNGDGELVHRAVGALDAVGLLKLGKTASDPTQQLSGLAKRFDNGDRDPVFLKTYAKVSQESGMENYQEVANAYLKTQSDLLANENIQFIYDFTYASSDAYYGFMVKNKAKFDQLIGKAEVDNRFKQAITYPMYREQDVDFKAIKKALSEVFADATAQQYTDEFEMNYYSYRLRSEDFKAKYLKAAVAYFDKYDIKEWDVLNGTAWTVFENTADTEILKKACAWAEKSVKLESNFYNNDTVAAICHQLGDDRRAKKYAKKAIELGTAEGEDVSATQELLDKINGK
jgi:thiol-disulfide isomerase/thioredoxin